LCIACNSVKWCSHFGKRSGNSLNCYHKITPHDLAVSLLGMYPREVNTYFFKNTNVWSSVIHDSQKLKTSQCPSTFSWAHGNKWRKCGISVHCDITDQKKDESTDKLLQHGWVSTTLC
jgi:hypothetical protein